MTMNLKLAGVTFDNEDGTSRQKLLETMYQMPAHMILVDMIETTYDGERAVKVLESKSKYHIGWVKKADLAKYEKFPDQMTASVNYYKNTYYVELSICEAPSQKQYHTVKSIVAKKHMPKPIYDKKAYAAFLQEHK